VGLSYKKAVFVIKRTRYQQFIPGRVLPAFMQMQDTAIHL